MATTYFETEHENIKFSFRMSSEGMTSIIYNDEHLDAPWPHNWYIINMKIEDSSTNYSWSTRFFVPAAYWETQWQRRSYALSVIYKYIKFPEKITCNDDIKECRSSVQSIRELSILASKNAWTQVNLK